MKSRDLTNLLLIYSPEPSLLWCHHPLMSPSCQIKRHWAPHLRSSMVHGQYSKFRANSVKILDSPKMFQCRAKTHQNLYLIFYILVSCITIRFSSVYLITVMTYIFTTYLQMYFLYLSYSLPVKNNYLEILMLVQIEVTMKTIV